MDDQRPDSDAPRPDPEPAEERPKPFTYRAQREERLRRAEQDGLPDPSPREPETGRLDGCLEPKPRKPPSA